ncbi:adenylylsulfatase HINT3 [Impatiens glandulifera]|uniref:adenylylsulfatase HINT3 n=1 Tax=Impatiens glandulifera TaxID=253017 RepID=UPI001FB16D6E|nr:adenylylsulfatase HINT3 [Impatiens glandulifera]
MDAARRFSILSSHLRPTALFPPACSEDPSSPSLWRSNCSSTSSVNDEDGDPKYGCVFCKISRGESPALKIYEDDICFCILDINPVINGHSLIIPKSHFSSLQETPPHVIGAMCSKVPFISSAVMKATGCDSFNLLVNNGAASGQVIFHTHLHIIPRKTHDCLWTSESLRRLPLKLGQEALRLLEEIRKELKPTAQEEEKERNKVLVAS